MGKETTVQTIKINNGKLEQKRNDNGELHWYRNGKLITKYGMSKYRYYDKNMNGLMKLTEYGVAPYTPVVDALISKASKRANSPAVMDAIEPFYPSKNNITLRTKGRMNLATIPNNVLDSIYISTGRAKGAGYNVSPKTSLGLVGKESTFGGMSIPLGKDPGMFYKMGLVNNYWFNSNSENNYLQALNRRYNTNNTANEISQDSINRNWLRKEENAKYAVSHGLIDKANNTYYEDDGLADGFARYVSAPTKYNPGQGNYVSMVNNIANEVWNEPQIQKQWAEEGRKYYEKGIKEGQEYTKRNKKENGGYIRRTIGGKYSIF